LAVQQPGLSDLEATRRKATFLAALATLGEGGPAWPALVHTPDPTLRSFLIERLGTAGIDPRLLKDRLDVEPDVSARRALILAMGNLPGDQMPELIPYLTRLYEHDPDCGIHSACQWVLRTWKPGDPLAPPDRKLSGSESKSNRGWFVNREQQTFSTITMPPAGMRIRPHRFAIGTTEVTVQQYRAFRKDHVVDVGIAPSQDCPVHMISWYDAAEYCNWLSARDDIPESEWCYRRNQKGDLDLVNGFADRLGYRLMTEAEWIFARWAHSQTSFHFGQADEELANCYAWWLGNSFRGEGKNRSHSVGLLKPNDFGLFDTYGNVAEMTLEVSPKPSYNDVLMLASGGSFRSEMDRLAMKEPWAEIARKSNIHQTLGIRVVRTIKQSP
jgi:formylglycine-generating enzyme required for sulfatase activity